MSAIIGIIIGIVIGATGMLILLLVVDEKKNGR